MVIVAAAERRKENRNYPGFRRVNKRGEAVFARFDPAARWLTDLEPVFASRFPYEPARYAAVPGELPGLYSMEPGPVEPDEPGELMVPAI